MGFKDDNYASPTHRGHNPYLQEVLNKLTDMEKIPTAEEFLMKEELVTDINEQKAWLSNVKRYMIEFAKLHVEAALKAASINAETEQEAGNLYDPEDRYYVVNKDSILNAYPLENVK